MYICTKEPTSSSPAALTIVNSHNISRTYRQPCHGEEIMQKSLTLPVSRQICGRFEEAYGSIVSNRVKEGSSSLLSKLSCDQKFASSKANNSYTALCIRETHEHGCSSILVQSVKHAILHYNTATNLQTRNLKLQQQQQEHK